MVADSHGNRLELDALFRKYESAPDSYVFAPLADAFRKEGRLEEAVEVCRKGVRRHPDYPSGHVVLGKCHFDVGEVDEAADSFRRVLELDANNLVALKYLGMIEAGRGRQDRAREYFKHILVLDPENKEIRSLLEDLHADAAPATPPAEVEDDDFEGEPISLGAGDEEMSDDLATKTLADIYAAQGYRDKALKIYREVLRTQPDNEEIRQKLDDLEGEGGATDALEFEPEDLTEPAREVPAAAGEPESRGTGPAGGGTTTPSDGPEEAEQGGKKAPQEKTAATIDDQKSYDQFKRWLKNIQQ